MPAARNLDMSPAGDATGCNFMSIPASLWQSGDPVQTGTSIAGKYSNDASLVYAHNERMEQDNTDCFNYDYSKHCIALSDFSDIYCKPVELHKGQVAISSASVEVPVNLTSNNADRHIANRNGMCISSTEICSSGSVISHLSAQSDALDDHKDLQFGNDIHRCDKDVIDLKTSMESLTYDVIKSLSDKQIDDCFSDYASDYTEDCNEGGLIIDTKDIDQEDSTECEIKDPTLKAADECVEAMKSSSSHSYVNRELEVTEKKNEMIAGSSETCAVSDRSFCRLKLESDSVETETCNMSLGVLLKAEETLTNETYDVSSRPANINDTCTQIKTEVTDLKLDFQLKAAKKKSLARHRAIHENFISNRMLSEWPSVAKCRVGAGLQNLGNTCFVNATIQCLTYTLPLVNYLFTCRDSLTCSVTELCLMCEMERHMKECFDNGGSIVKPHSILQKLKVIARHMRWGRQEDAHEFLRYMVEAMHKSCINGHQPLPENAKDVSVVNEIFGGILRSQVTCLKCQAKSNTYDPFLDISLDVKNVSTILRALERYVEPETLDTDNAYNCTKCLGKVRAQKRFTIHRLPHVLTIQLKRYGITGGKVTRHITFPEVLDVRPFVSACRGNSGNGENKDEDEKVSNEYKYRLYGVLVHEGHSTSSGHYYCYVSTASGGWYCMNDHMVRRSSLNQVLNAEAYLLFYKRGLVSAASTSRGHPCDNFSEDMLIRRNGPVRVCRSKAGVTDDSTQNHLSSDVDRSVSVSSAEECPLTSSPSRKPACLGGQQMCVMQGKRLLPPRLSCRGGQMNISLKSIGIVSRQIRKPQLLNVKSRKDIARYRHAVKKSCRDHKKMLDKSNNWNYSSATETKENEPASSSDIGLIDSINNKKTSLTFNRHDHRSEGNRIADSTSSSCVPHRKKFLPSNGSKKNRTRKNGVCGEVKESSLPNSIEKSGETCTPLSSGMPRIVLKIRQGRVVDSTVPGSYSVSDCSNNHVKSDGQIVCNNRIPVRHSDENATVKASSDCTDSATSAPRCSLTGSSAAKCNSMTHSDSSSTTSAAMGPTSLVTSVGGYDKLSQDYFLKLSQLCADVQSSSSARLSADHLHKPSANKSKSSTSGWVKCNPVIEKQKSHKFASVEPLGRKLSHTSAQQRKSKPIGLEVNSANTGCKKSTLSRVPMGPLQPVRQLNSATASSRSLLNKPTGNDSTSIPKVHDDKSTQQQRGDVYDFDMGDDTDNERCSVTLALHRQNSATNSDKDLIPTATMDVPGAYGSLVKMKRLFSHRSHTVIDPSNEFQVDSNSEEVRQSGKTDLHHVSNDNLFKSRKSGDTHSSFIQQNGKAAEKHSIVNIQQQGQYSENKTDIGKKSSKTALSIPMIGKNGKKGCLVNKAASMQKTQDMGVKRRLTVDEGGLVNNEISLGLHKKVKKASVASLYTDSTESNMLSSVLHVSPAVLISSHEIQDMSPGDKEHLAIPGVLPSDSKDVSHSNLSVGVITSPKSCNSSVSTLGSNQQSESLTRKEPELVAAKIGPLRLKICRVPDADSFLKMYNVVPSESTTSSKFAANIKSNEPVKQHSAGQRAPSTETSGPGRGTLAHD